MPTKYAPPSARQQHIPKKDSWRGSKTYSRNLIQQFNNLPYSTQSGPMDYDYTVNGIGNVVSISGKSLPALAQGTETYEYLPQSNKLDSRTTGQGVRQYIHDANGNIVSDGVFTYGYDTQNRLARVTQGENVIAEYVYDGYNRRVKKTVGTTTIVFHYDQNNLLIAETLSDGTPLVDYIYLDTTVVAMKRYGAQAGIYYVVNDHLSTPQMVLDETGAVVWQAAYEPFGKAHLVVSNIDFNIRFPGQYWDAETGLHYNWNRYYDPATGRYITADPIGLAGGMNLYSYANLNPVNMIDPEGLTVKLCKRALGDSKRRFGPAHHSYIWVNGYLYGFHPENKDKLYGKGSVENEEPGNDIKCGKALKCVDDSCVMQKIFETKGNPPDYSFGFFDCRAWAKMIILLCHKEGCCEE
ncbi:MAG: hypothetical protein Kow0089_24400 [Desulfobulbaceae bacterium]